MGQWKHDWCKVIDDGLLLSTLSSIEKQVHSGISISPDMEHVFEAFKACKYRDLNIVMLGQDPYPQKNVATGILFGNRDDVPDDKLSPSLKVIREAVICPEKPHSGVLFDNTLREWSVQGILMINSALTVETGHVGSHTMIWRPFISSLLKRISEDSTGIIYVLFGNQASTFKPYINSRFNYILEEKHPAYYARKGIRMPSTVFNEINRIMLSNYGKTIKWFKEY